MKVMTCGRGQHQEMFKSTPWKLIFRMVTVALSHVFHQLVSHIWIGPNQYPPERAQALHGVSAADGHRSNGVSYVPLQAWDDRFLIHGVISRRWDDAKCNTTASSTMTILRTSPHISVVSAFFKLPPSAIIRHLPPDSNWFDCRIQGRSSPSQRPREEVQPGRSAWAGSDLQQYLITCNNNWRKWKDENKGGKTLKW